MKKSALDEILIRLIAACIFIQLILTKTLWSGADRSFPRLPVFDFWNGEDLLYIQSLFWWCLLIVLAGMITMPARRLLTALFLFLSLLLVSMDINRLQVWFYLQWMFLVMLFFIKKEKLAFIFNILRICLIAVYCWSGIHKLNVYYINDTFPWLLETFELLKPLGKSKFLAITSGIFEASLGFGLLFVTTRKIAGYLVVLFHVFVLLFLGPLGHNWNEVVWPWNILMILLVWILFFDYKNKIIPPLIKNIRNYPLAIIPLILVTVMPFFNFFHKWDEQLSFKMYAGTNPEGIFYFDEKDKNCFPNVETEFNSLPPTFIPAHRIALDIWAFETLKTPPYTNRRTLLQTGEKLCNCLKNPELGGLEILTVNRWMEDSETIERIPCAGLNK